MVFLIFIFGFLFGATLWYAKLNKYNTISGMAKLENFAVAKAIAVALAVGAVLINIEIGLGFAEYHTKPVILMGLIVGGLIFGAGMAILGYCPGTLPISMGEGSVDAFIGFLGGVTGGLFYTVVYPVLRPALGPDLGNITLKTLTGQSSALFYIISFVFAIALILIAFWLHKKESGKDLKWLYAGIGLAVLNMLVFLTPLTGRNIGASSFYPYLAGAMANLTSSEYFNLVNKAGNWEMYFLIGAFAAGLLLSLLTRQFKFVLLHSGWKQSKGVSIPGRVIWSFIGGFLLLFGARMASGCTSGHVISGGMQLAVSSYTFAIFVFAGLLVTGRFFYRKASLG